MTDTNDESSHDYTPGMEERARQEQASGPVEDDDNGSPGDFGVSGFTEEQLAQLQDLIASQGHPQVKGRLRGWLGRSLTRGRIFVQAAAPPDEETDFDQDTLTGRLAARASKHRGVTALMAVVAILMIGGLWGMILGGGLALPVVVAIVAAVLGTGLVIALLAQRRGQ